MCVFLYVFPCTLARLHRLWEPGNRRTRRDERAVVDRCPVLLPAVLRCVSLFASYKKANSRTWYGRVKGTPPERVLEKTRTSLSHVVISSRKRGKKGIFARYRRVVNPESAISLSLFLSLLSFALLYYLCPSAVK